MSSKPRGKKAYDKSARRRSLGLENPGYDGERNPIVPEWKGYRSPADQLLGDPPIGRSALDTMEHRR